MFTKNADGSYKIRTKITGEASAVEVTSALMTSGANVQQWEINGANCQDWILEPASTELPTEPPTEPVTEEPTDPVTDAPDTPEEEPVVYGDANCDTEISMPDVVIVMQSCLNPSKYGLGQPDGITEKGLRNADVDGVEGVSPTDALVIQRYTLSLIDTLPVK